MSLVAEVLEAAGIVTVVVGSARDIVEEVGVPRFVFSDFPLGSPFGAKDETDIQMATLRLALDVAATAAAPRTTVQSTVAWEGDDWRESFMHVGDDNRAELAAMGERRRAEQAAVKANR
ncbi:MAG: hypothetical protein GY708_02035 [Actinomycetia bacterium]|nr:hypothetical protein [Actinomycetes bacterium]MCP4961024.1 hypothetical protein [Actinomycetes bacterium]